MALVVVVILVIIGASVASAPKAGNQGCSPAPCANADGFVVSVGTVNRNVTQSADDIAAPPDAGNHYVDVMVTFRNTTSSEQDANPFNFVLKDADGVKHTVEWFGGQNCGSWSAVNLTTNATLANKSLCFQAGGDPKGKLTLVWTPGIADYNIDLTGK